MIEARWSRTLIEMFRILPKNKSRNKTTITRMRALGGIEKQR